MTEILAVGPWKNNAEMFVDVFNLHVPLGSVVVDPTFGEGNFYTYMPDWPLIGHDKHKGPCFDKVDWGDLPEEDASVDVVVFDPPYVSRGGRKTSTLDKDGMIDAYGMDSAAHSPEALWTDIERGIDEAWRVLKPKGLLMLKVMPYISSGHLQNVLMWAFESFRSPERPFELHDWFILNGDPGPQPKSDKCRECIDGKTQRATLAPSGPQIEDIPCPKCGGAGTIPRRQVHARNNASHLLVVKKMKPKVKQAVKRPPANMEDDDGCPND